MKGLYYRALAIFIACLVACGPVALSSAYAQETHLDPTFEILEQEKPIAKGKKNKKNKPDVLGHQLLDQAGRPLDQIRNGEYADLEATVLCPGVLTSDVGDAGGLFIEKLDDAFILTVDTSANPAWDGVPKAEILSQGSEPLVVRATFPHALYEGAGKQLRFRMTYRTLSMPDTVVKIKMRECVKGAAPVDNAGSGATDATDATQNPEDAEAGALSSRPKVDKCRVLIGGKAKKKLSAGKTADLEVTITNAGILTEQMEGGQVTAQKLEDDFTGNDAPRVEVLSKNGKPLKLKLTFPNLTYSGTGNSLRFSMRYGALALPADILCVTVRGAKGKAKPQAEPTPAPMTPDPTPPVSESPTQAPENGVVSATQAPENGVVSATQAPSETKDKVDLGLTTQPARSPMPLGAPAVPAAPDPTLPPLPTDPPVIPAPVLRITRADIAPAIEPSQPFTVTLYFQNIGVTDVQLPVAVFTPSTSLSLMESTSSMLLPRLRPGEKTSINVRMKAADDFESATQSLGVEVKFEYNNGTATTPGTTTELVLIPVNPKIKDAAAPDLQVGREDFGKPIKAGQSFSLNVWIKNAGRVAVESGMAAFSATDGLMLLEETPTVVIGKLQPGEIQNISLNFKALKQIASQLQGVNVELKYTYLSGRTLTQQTATEKVLVPAEITKPKAGGGGGGATKPKVDAPTPNVIVSKYDFGADQVAAGSEFNLALTFQNTSPQKTVENIVMTLETGESVAISDASNTFYYTELGPGQTQTEKIKMQALSSAKSGSGKVDVSFKYEFVDNDKRTAVTVTEKLSIPVYQADRFNLTAPVVPESVMPGEETVISLPYVNKGKSEVFNLSAELMGDLPALNKTQNLGNLEAGKSGSIDFIVTPEMAGEQDVTVKVSYEDANQAVVEQKFPLKVLVQDAALAEGDMAGMEGGMVSMDGAMEGEAPMEGEGGGLRAILADWRYLAGGGGALVLLMILWLRAKKRKKRRASKAAFVFEDEGEAKPAEPAKEAPKP
ncbi:MAG: hypothetical protein RR452_06840 [Clostridia bacterium]